MRDQRFHERADGLKSLTTDLNTTNFLVQLYLFDNGRKVALLTWLLELSLYCEGVAEV